MTDVEIRDWSDAIEARRLDDREARLLDLWNATRGKSIDNARRQIRKARKIHLNEHKVFDPRLIEQTTDRIMRQLGKKPRNSPKA